MIGYPSGQDGTILPARDYPPCPARPSFLGQDVWLLASFFFCEFIDLDSVSIYKHAKKELGQYAAISTLRLVNSPNVFPAGHVLCFDWLKAATSRSVAHLGKVGPMFTRGRRL